MLIEEISKSDEQCILDDAGRNLFRKQILQLDNYDNIRNSSDDCVNDITSVIVDYEKIREKTTISQESIHDNNQINGE